MGRIPLKGLDVSQAATQPHPVLFGPKDPLYEPGTEQLNS